MTFSDPADAVPDWLGALSMWLDKAGKRGVRCDASPDDDAPGRRDESRLAHATALRLALADRHEPGRQLVVLGPTQAGKSTVVNRLLDTEVAGVSALAGHTVHAQAFVRDDRLLRAQDHLPALLGPLRQVARASLDADVLDTWSLEAVLPGEYALAPADATVWDTPDFDSIAASSYREAVTLASALADAIVLVLSKDKYGDQSAWQRLRTLRSLGTPLVLVVNKVDAASRDTIARALTERLGDAPPPVVLLPWIDRPADSAPLDLPVAVQQELAAALDLAWRSAANRPARRRSLQHFIEARRDDWLAPLRTELAARERWHAAIDDSASHLVAGYEARWLGGAEHGDAFDRTLVELLALLEVPGFAKLLQRTRQAVTWPARRLLGLGLGGASRLVRSASSRLGMTAGANDTTPAARERRVLEELLDAALLQLRDQVLDERSAADEPGFWRTLDKSMTAQRPALQTAWSERAAELHAEFQPRIQATARQLYERLQTQPALLNTLRATRLGTDAAGVALAIKSGGMAPADLILAPAMLSVTSLLTESALGRYLDGVRRELEQAQLEAVEQTLVLDLLVPQLRSMATDEGDMTAAIRPEALAALQREVLASRERIAARGS